MCPNLKVLTCRGFRLSSKSRPQLLNSLSKSIKLVELSLDLWSSRSRNAVPLQQLIDLLSSMTQLSHLKLSFMGGDDSEDTSEDDTIHFEEKKFPLVRRLDLRLPTTAIILHLSNSFSRTARSDGLLLKSPDKIYSVDGYRVECLSTKN